MLLPGALVPKQTWSLEDQTWLIIMEVKMAAGCLLGNSGCLSTRNFGGISCAYVYSCSDFWEFSRHTPVPISGWIQRLCFSCLKSFWIPRKSKVWMAKPSATWPGILDLTKAPGTSVLPLPVKAIPQASWQPPSSDLHHSHIFPSIAGNFFHKFIWQRFNESSWHLMYTQTCLKKRGWNVFNFRFTNHPGTPQEIPTDNQTTTSGQEANDVTTHQAAGNALPR